MVEPTHLKNMLLSNWIHLPQRIRDENHKQYLSCHHLVYCVLSFPLVENHQTINPPPQRLAVFVGTFKEANLHRIDATNHTPVLWGFPWGGNRASFGGGGGYDWNIPLTGWWLNQPRLKNMSQKWESSPSRWWKWKICELPPPIVNNSRCFWDWRFDLFLVL